MVDPLTPAKVLTLKSIPHPGELAEVIAGHYGLSTVRCHLIQSTRRDVFEVTSDQGRFILHLYPHVSYFRLMVEDEWEVVSTLHEAGVPVVRGVKTAAGNWSFAISAPEGIRYATLSHYVPGGHLRHRYSREAVRAYGRAIGLLHRTGSAFTPSAARDDIHQFLLRMLLDGAEVFAEIHPHRSEEAEALRRAVDVLRPRINALPRSAPVYTLVHGDAIRANCQVSPEGSVTILDFDLCGRGWRAYDVASYMQVDSDGPFLEGYHEVQTLTDQEVSWLPMLVSVRLLVSLVIPCLHAQTWGSAALWDGEIDATVKLLRDEIDALERG
jgi:Ser/Thr protein kinase RdoA (MazF antagonist)